jgi:outer membrane protein assembly factor BamB
MLRAACLALVVSAGPALAADWPQFRGPTGDGHYTGAKLPTEWGTDKNVAWKTPVPGKGWSSPIVWKDKVYLTTAVPQANGDQSLRALCLNAATGKVEWDREVFLQAKAKAPNIHGKNSHASPTPTTDGERLYVHFGHTGTAALDLAGKVLWTRTGLYDRPVHGNGGSPILVDGRLIFSCDGADKQFVIALDGKSGETAWQTPRKTSTARFFSFSTPTVVADGTTKQVVSEGSDLIAGYDPATGKELWRFAFTGYSVIPKPVVGHGLLFFSTGYDRPALRAIKVGTGTPEEAWTLSKGAPHTPSPLLVGTEIYVVSDKGILTCVDAKTGEVVWEERVKGNYSASPIYADGKIYLTSEEGKGTVVQAGRKFDLVSESDLKEKTFASFAAVDGALYVRTESQLYKFAGR